MILLWVSFTTVLIFMPTLNLGAIESFSISICRKGKYDLIYDKTSFVQCVEKCRSKNACFGVSVFLAANICRLHIVLEINNAQEVCVGYVHSLKTNWPQKTLDECGDNPCGVRETCIVSTTSDILCVQSECDTVANIRYGEIYGSNNLKVGSKVLYKCDRQINNVNNDVIRKCLSNGQWSGSLPVCPSTECATLPSIQNGIVQGVEQRSIGSEVQYVCIDTFKVKRGNERRTCLPDLSWSGIQPTCLQYEFKLPWNSGSPIYTIFDLFDNDISFVNTDVILFDLKAIKDASILLQPYRGALTSNVMEVVFGGWGNEQCVIRRGILSYSFLSVYREEAIINNEYFSSFWIKSTSSCIQANICRLHANNGTLNKQNPCPGYVFTEKGNWNEKITPACENTCEEHETCLDDGSKCEYEECIPIDPVLYGTTFGDGQRKVGAKIKVKCNRLVNAVIVYVTRTCQLNGTWSGAASCPLPEFVLPPRSGHPNYQQFDMFENNVSFVYTDTILFKVKAKNDVHLLLQINRITSPDSDVIELVLGGWGNSKSVLRQGINGNMYHSSHHEWGIVNGLSYSDFWITSNSSCIVAGKGTVPPSSTILQYCGVTAQHKYLSIGVGYGSWANYLFP